MSGCNPFQPRFPARAAVLALLGLTASVPSGHAQASIQALSADALREDLEVFRTALGESHAGLYWYLPPADLDRRLEAIEDALDRPMSARAFYRLLLPVVGALGHGHTTLTLPVDGVGYRLRHLDAAGAYFPFAVRVLGGRLYVDADLSDAGDLAPGTEILSVNGQPASVLLAAMRPLVSADGFSGTYRAFRLGPNFEFHHLLDLLHGPADTFSVDVLPLAGGAAARRGVPASTPAQIAERYRERTGRGIDEYPPALRSAPLVDRAALLTVGSFYEGRLGAGHPGFEAFLDSTFRAIREGGVTDLVVDVRGNEGGNDDHVPLLYSYLVDRPFALPDTPTELASASLSSLPYVEGPSDVVRAFAASPGDFVDRSADGAWTLKPAFDEARYRTFDPASDAFTGRLYVLTDGGSFSATNGFLDLVYRYHRGEGRSVRFVGEENGGDNARGLASGGQMIAVVLPNSGLRLSVPLLGVTRHLAGAEPSATIPDHVVTPSVLDMVDGTDRALAFVLRLIDIAQGAP